MDSSLKVRHEGHGHTSLHYINIKYGYLIICSSVIFLFAILIFKHQCRRSFSRPLKFSNSAIYSPFSISIAFWVTVTLIISFWNISFKDHISVFLKRQGRLAYALAPLDIVLAMKPGFGIGYLEFVDLHKWTSRLILVFGFIHGIGFIAKWIYAGTISKLFKLLNFLGAIVFGASVALIVISVRYLRRRSYKAFYLTHNLAVLSFIFLISFHARPGTPFLTLLCCILLLVLIYQRYARTSHVSNISVSSSDGSDLIVVSFESTIEKWGCNSHVRLGYPVTDYRFWLFPSHPYTIVTECEHDSIIKLIIKRSTFEIAQPNIYSLTGPYNSFAENAFIKGGRSVIICGGSGISFGLPVFSKLKESGFVKFIWCVKTYEDTHVLSKVGFDESIDIFITGDAYPKQSNTNTVGSNSSFFVVDDDAENIEMLPISETEDGGHSSKPPPKPPLERSQIHYGRPDIRSVLSVLDNSEDTTVFTCGPKSLVTEVQAWCATYSLTSYSELYEL